MRAEVPFVLSQFTRLTDGWSDGQTDAHRNTVAAQMQRGKNRSFCTMQLKYVFEMHIVCCLVVRLR